MPYGKDLGNLHIVRRSKKGTLINKDSWSVYRCPSCGLGFLDPRPSQDEIEQLYRSEYFSQHYDGGLEPDSPQFRRRIRGEEHRIRFIKQEKRSGKLLDIGCGYGYFLAACRDEGYEVNGFDVSEWAAEYAIQRLGLPVTIGQMGDVTFPPHSFDIITMWHFLEHMPDPHLALQKAKSWLKRDGILVVDVPNYEGTDARHMWEEWTGWSLPYHFWHFTFESLTRLLHRHGFRVIKSKDYHSDVVKEKLRRIPVVNLFARLIAKMYSGTSVAVTAKLANEK
jgi:2-polyprenyl-3-methyl-5-hydroxy-6-metoxy-1,4-benzoquinol methylase